MKSIDPQQVPASALYALMSGVVVPRPIAFASTADLQGNANLSPFSFFNLFSSIPPVLVFSPLSRMRDNSSKHTLQNILATKEVVINIGNYDLVEQMSLASTEYEEGIDEFIKAGLTPEASIRVQPPRVREAPAAFECKVTEVVKLGSEGGAGNLVLCEVLLMHINEQILDENGKVDPLKLNAVARMGGDFYMRTTKEGVFELPKPLRNKGMGVDQLPEFIRNSNLLTGNNLGRLGNTEKMPSPEKVAAFKSNPMVAYILTKHRDHPDITRHELEKLGKKLLDDNQVQEAWKVLLLRNHI